MDQLHEALARTRQADLAVATRHRARPVPGTIRRVRADRRRRADEL